MRSMGSAGHTGMLGALSAVSTALAASPDLKITALSYHDGTTDLTVDAPAVGTIDQFQKAISSQGFAALMQSTTQHETRYQGHVQIKGAG